MLKWLDRQEKIYFHAQYLQWQTGNWASGPEMYSGNNFLLDLSPERVEIVDPDAENTDDNEGVESLAQSHAVACPLRPTVSAIPPKPSHVIAKRPPRTHQLIDNVVRKYDIPGFVHALKVYLLKDTVQPGQLQQKAHQYELPTHWQSLGVWDRVTVVLPTIGFDARKPERQAILACLDTKKDCVPCFQTILVDLNPNDPTPQDGIHGKSHFFK
jgi:hypothetical protein